MNYMAKNKSTSSKLKIKPFGRRIYLQAVMPAGKFITNDSVKLNDKWKIVAIGDEVKKLKVGDVLFLKGYALEHVEDDDTGILHSFTFEDDDFILCVCETSNHA